MNATKIILHCTDSPNGQFVSVDTIRKWHLKRGFTDIGYHIVIQPDGQVDRGRSLNQAGAHCEGENNNSIGVCLVGKDKYTRRQWRALESTLDSLFITYNNIPHYALYCHSQFPSAQKQGKTCPNIEINRLLLWYHCKDDKAIEPLIFKENA